MPSVKNRRFPFDTSRSPLLAEVALDGTVWQVVQLFHHVHTGRCLYCRQCSASHTPITPRATPATTGNILVDQECHHTDSQWSNSG